MNLVLFVRSQRETSELDHCFSDFFCMSLEARFLKKNFGRPRGPKKSSK